MSGTTYAGDNWVQNSGQQSGGGWNFYSYGAVRNEHSILDSYQRSTINLLDTIKKQKYYLLIILYFILEAT